MIGIGQVGAADTDDGILDIRSLIIEDETIDTVATMLGHETVIVNALPVEHGVMMVTVPCVSATTADKGCGVVHVSGMDIDDMADERITTISRGARLVIGAGGGDFITADDDVFSFAEVMTNDGLLGSRTTIDLDRDDRVATILGLEFARVSAGGGDRGVAKLVFLSFLDIDYKRHLVRGVEMQDVINDTVATGVAG